MVGMNFETTMKRPNPNPRPELYRWSFHKKHSWQKQVKSTNTRHDGDAITFATTVQEE